VHIRIEPLNHRLPSSIIRRPQISRYQPYNYWRHFDMDERYKHILPASSASPAEARDGETLKRRRSAVTVACNGCRARKTGVSLRCITSHLVNDLFSSIVVRTVLIHQSVRRQKTSMHAMCKASRHLRLRIRHL
jgi:hypothetical protein